jgi:succinate dehydrogenase / fumarate reductase iron-sulfur subunit
MIDVRPPAEVRLRAEASLGDTAARGEAAPSGVAQLRVFRGEPGTPSRYEEFDVPVEEGMVVLDALHWIQANGAPDLAVRWNCKAAKCGSCGAEVNGRPRLTCKTRLSDFDLAEQITVEPMRTFPLVRDLVTDVSWNYAVNRSIEPFSPPADVPQSEWRWQQEDIERVQEFRKCIECFLCQDVCHVLRNHETERPFMGPRFLVRTAGLEMHPIDQADRRGYLKDVGGVGYCNITKCCTEVCPEHIKITDNSIIPLKERVADEFYDPIQWAWRKLRGRSSDTPSRAQLPVLQARSAAIELSPEPTPERLARAVGEDSLPAEPMTPEAAAASAPTEAGKVAKAERPTTEPRPSRATANPRPKRARRRSDAGDETPSET